MDIHVEDSLKECATSLRIAKQSIEEAMLRSDPVIKKQLETISDGIDYNRRLVDGILLRKS